MAEGQKGRGKKTKNVTSKLIVPSHNVCVVRLENHFN